MPRHHSAIFAAVLLLPFFCARQMLVQEVPAPDRQFNPVQMGLARESKYHRCFETSNGARDAIRRLPADARSWLTEDAVYIITPEERCAFLLLNTDDERNQFIERFWYRRAANPILLDYDFKAEHYRRIVFANQNYGGQIAGWKTDRGRVYILFGPPDSVEANKGAPGTPSSQGAETDLHPTETWHYHYINGIGENTRFDFEYVGDYIGYRLTAPSQDLIGQADLTPDRFPRTPENIQLYVVTVQPPKIRFKDLEAVLTSRIARDQVKFRHRTEFVPVTHATTLARLDIKILCETCTHDGQLAPSRAYPLFIRVSRASGWVVHTSELTADVAARDKSGSTLILDAHLDVPLPPGVYELAIVAKNAATGEVGAVRAQLDVPTYEALAGKN